jgi:hypothetical protein
MASSFTTPPFFDPVKFAKVIDIFEITIRTRKCFNNSQVPIYKIELYGDWTTMIVINIE